MAIAQLSFMLGPLLGAVAGYVVAGVTGTTSGFAIVIGPVVVTWLCGRR